MTTEQDNGTGKITYTVRELLTELKVMVQTIDAKLDAKAEKSVVENLSTRLSIVETERRTEREYGNQLLAEYKEQVKKTSALELAVNALQTNKKDKEAFDLKWIPIAASLLGVIGEFIYLLHAL